MQYNYPKYLRYYAPNKDCVVDDCPGKNCDGNLEDNRTTIGKILKSGEWTCDTCGVVYAVTGNVENGYAVVDFDQANNFDETVDGQYAYENGDYRRMS